MYEKHLELAVLTVSGHAKEAMAESKKDLDNTDRYAIQLSICDYIGDKANAYEILKKLTKEEEMLNNLIMEDDINEMNSDLQVVEAKREMSRNWIIFLVVMFHQPPPLTPKDAPAQRRVDHCQEPCPGERPDEVDFHPAREP